MSAEDREAPDTPAQDSVQQQPAQGSHPVAGAAGAAAGAVAGAAAGVLGGPAGMAAGAVAGGVLGAGLGQGAGKGIDHAASSESLNRDPGKDAPDAIDPSRESAGVPTGRE